ncbi:MAG: hypothetical protein ACLT8A_11055 [Subdoligranulum sp.]
MATERHESRHVDNQLRGRASPSGRPRYPVSSEPGR